MVFQGLISGWVRVNQKHVFFSSQDDQQQQQEQQQANDSALMGNPPSSRRNKDGNNTNNPNGSSILLKPSKKEHFSQTTTSGTTDAEIQAIRRFKNRIHHRKLKRTVSHTDLLREMAKEMEKEDKQAQKDDPGGFPSENASSGNSRDQDKDISQTSNQDPPEEHSLRVVAGFFGTDMADPNSMARHQPQRSKLTGKYLNEQAFVQQLENNKTATHRRRLSTPSQETSESEASMRPQVATKPDCLMNSDSVNSGFVGPPSSMRGNTLLPKQESKQNPINNFFRGFPHSRHHCATCEEFENRLLAADADRQYLRSVALRNEIISKKCESKANQKMSSIKTPYESATLSEASKRLVEVTSRHKRQVEQLTKDRSRWQQDMNVRLSKVAAVSKDLNDESEMLKQEMMDLRQETKNIIEERDALAAQLQSLRTEATFFQRQRNEHILLREILQKYETEGLIKSHEAIDQRDHIINDLSVRLEHALETLDFERQQQRQRRQIIFPQRGSMSSFGGETSSNEVEALKEELRRANEATHQALAALNYTKAEADCNDKVWMLRCKELEKQINR